MPLLSGLLYQKFGLIGCLWTSAGLVVAAGLFSCMLPANNETRISTAAVGGDESTAICCVNR